MKVLSIEIGLQETKICEIINFYGIRRIIKSVVIPTPSNTVEDGYIRDKATFSEHLKNVIHNEKFSTNHVIFSVASTKIYTKEVVIPHVPKSKIKDIISTNISEYLPFSIEEYVINYSVIESIKVQSKKKFRVLLIAVPENMVKNYYSTAEMAGLEVDAIDYIGNSVYQVLKLIPEKGINVYIQINEQSTMVSILKDRTLVLQRTIAYGTNEMIQAVIENNEQSLLDEQKAYQLLENQNFITKEISRLNETELEFAASSEESINVNRVADAVTDTVSYLVNSLERVVDYYINQSGNTIQKIYLLGHGARIAGMNEYIHNELGIHPQTVKEIQGFQVGKQTDDYKKNPSEYINCLGAVVSPLGFEPKDLLAKKEKRSNVIETSVIICVCLVGSLILFQLGVSEYNLANKELTNIKLDFTSMPTPEHSQSEFEKVLQQLQDIENLHQTTKTNMEQVYEVLETLEDNLVTIADIKTMQMNSEAVTMQVAMPSKESAAKLILQLETLTEDFEAIQITSLSEIKDESGISVVSFGVTCQFHDIVTSEGESVE